MIQANDTNSAEPCPRQPSYSHAAPLSDPGLASLRDQIKNVMIPMLIRIFQFKLDLGQALSPPSKLSNAKPKESLEEVEKHLKRLDEDLKLLSLWCQSCRTQIGKALNPQESGETPTLSSFSPAQRAEPLPTEKSRTLFSGIWRLFVRGSTGKKS